MNNKEIKEKGITLVALVVTVIVLMILAGITLTLVLGQNGIIGKAKEAKEVSANADKATGEGLNNLYNGIVAATSNQSGEATIETVSGKELSLTENTAIKDDNGNIVTIPAGFHISNDSKTKQEDGIVVEDAEGNQFVWIPVADITDYKRTDFVKQEGVYSSYLETMPIDEQTSVSKYHGYYIGRYEAGDSVSTANKILRTDGASINNKVVIKKGQTPYNYITRDQSNILAIGMKTSEGYISTTKLCSSYAWDTAVNFIQNKVPNYATTSPQGNYCDTTFEYTDITGISQTKALNAAVIVPTGQTTPICNIYDMGGNVWEWTTETNSDTTNPYVFYGGGDYNYYSDGSAGYRWCSPVNAYGYNRTFRIALYM